MDVPLETTGFIGRLVTVRIDRPMGSRHAEWGHVYPVNYGFVPGVPAPDGEELDAYVPGVLEPVAVFTGRCTAVIRHMDDDDDELVIVPNGVSCRDEQIRALTEFQERFFSSVIVRPEDNES